MGWDTIAESVQALGDTEIDDEWATDVPRQLTCLGIYHIFTRPCGYFMPGATHSIRWEAGRGTSITQPEGRWYKLPPDDDFWFSEEQMEVLTEICLLEHMDMRGYLQLLPEVRNLGVNILRAFDASARLIERNYFIGPLKYADVTFMDGLTLFITHAGDNWFAEMVHPVSCCSSNSPTLTAALASLDLELQDMIPDSVLSDFRMLRHAYRNNHRQRKHRRIPR